MKSLFIVNPAAGHGRAGKRWAQAQALARKIFPDMEVRLTERQGHGRELARAAIEAGVPLVVAVGGDGTVGEAVDGYLSASEAARRASCLATFPAGSGCDFANHMRVPREPRAWAAAFAAGTPRDVDAARATFTGADGKTVSRYFMNLAAVGIPGDISAGIARRGKLLGGTLTYLVEGAIGVLLSRPRRVRLVIDGIEEPAAKYHLIAAANTSTTGGGMKLSPEADAHDGLLDLVTIADIPRARLMTLLPRAYSGGHVGREGVVIRRVARVEIIPEEPMPLNIDGDADGFAPATFEVLPKAVRFRL